MLGVVLFGHGADQRSLAFLQLLADLLDHSALVERRDAAASTVAGAKGNGFLIDINAVKRIP